MLRDMLLKILFERVTGMIFDQIRNEPTLETFGFVL